MASDAFGNELGDGACAVLEDDGQQEQALAQTQQSTKPVSGLDAEAAFGQLADAFSPADEAAPSAWTMLLASNDLTQPGQPVVTDAGYGVSANAGAAIFSDSQITSVDGTYPPENPRSSECSRFRRNFSTVGEMVRNGADRQRRRCP